MTRFYDVERDHKMAVHGEEMLELFFCSWAYAEPKTKTANFSIRLRNNRMINEKKVGATIN